MPRRLAFGRRPRQSTAVVHPARHRLRPAPDDAIWARRDPAGAGFDGAELEAAIEYARTHETTRPRDYSDQQRVFGRPLGPLPASRGGTNGLILRGGAIVAEFGDTSAAEPFYSAAKSMLSTLLGLALDRGLIEDIDARVGEQVKDGGYDSPQNQAITWRHHATQSSEWEGTLFGKPHTFLGVEEFGEGARQPRALQAPGTYYESNDVPSTASRSRCCACGSGRCPRCSATR